MNSTFDIQNITDGQGVGIAITGMVIVFFALTVISLFISALPIILNRVAKRWPETPGHHQVSKPSAQPSASSGTNNEVVAAISLALHRKRGQA